MKKPLQWGLVMLAALWAVGPAWAVELEVVGAPEALEENIRAYIGDLPQDEAMLGRAFRERLVEQAQQAAIALGYYNANIDAGRRTQGEEPVIRLQVEPGERVRLDEVDIRVTGGAADDPAFRQLIEELPLQPGEPLSHGEYESAKGAIQRLALRRGYLQGEYETSRVAVDAVDNTADLALVYASGPRFRIGEVRFPDDLPLRDEFLQRLVPFEPDAPYEAGRIAELNRALLESGYFADVRVRPLPEEAEDERVPVVVELGIAEPNRVAVGLGYTTDVGPRARLTWFKPWINRRGHSLTAEIEASPVRQSFSTQYRIPLEDPLDDSLEFQFAYIDEELGDTETEVITTSVQRQHRFESGWIRSVYLRLEREEFEMIGGGGETTLVLPGVSFTRNRSRGGVAPTWAERVRGVLEATSESIGSDVSLVRTRAQARFLRSFDDHYVTLGGTFGAIYTDDFENVPPSLRFFAGGTQSIRGFDFNELSPLNEAGEAVGGRYLLTGTAQYAYEFRPRWRAAVFADAGNAFESWSDDIAVGAGFGVHWVSPIGLVQVDFAWGVSEEDPPFALHVSLGTGL